MKSLTSQITPVAFKIAFWFSAFALALSAVAMNASTTYIVGGCKSGSQTQFLTIQSAVDTVPSGATVEICPGQYAEQILITRPVTLQGIPAGNGAMAQIILPYTYAPNATLRDADGDFISAVAQIYVKTVEGGAANLEQLEVNGMGFGMSSEYFVGIFYEGSSGTINQVITSSQNDNPLPNISGFGMWIEGGSSKESVTVENASIHDFAHGGIYAVGLTPTPDLTVSIKNNNIASNAQETYNLVVEQGTDPTVSGNVISGGFNGIYIDTTSGSITDNVVLGSEVGVSFAADGASVTSNKILDATLYGIDTGTNLLHSTIQNNTIASVNSIGSIDSLGTGIELNCGKVSSSHVKSNTLIDLEEGYGDAPTGFASSDTFVGVVSKISTCSGGDSDSRSARAKAHPKFSEN